MNRLTRDDGNYAKNDPPSLADLTNTLQSTDRAHNSSLNVTDRNVMESSNT